MTPQPVLDILKKLDATDQEIVKSYIDKLETQIGGDDADDDDDDDMATEEPTMDAASAAAAAGEAPFPPLYETGEDFDKASELKQEAADAKSNGDWEVALEKYTAAVLAAPPSALLYANRATALLNLSRPYAAERDCTEALNENPDSAKALRIRGKARKELGQWEAALKDVSASQTIDFDEGTVEDLKFLMEKHLDMEKEVAAKRNTGEDKLRKRAEEIKKAQEDAKRDAAEAAAESMPMGEGMGGMPGGMGGMPGGMGGGMPGGMDMSGLMGMMADPEMREAMSNPKVQKALQEVMSGPGGPAGLMSNPAKLQELMSDPEVGPVIQKLMGKIGGAGGMGGMGGMPGMGGAPGGAGGDDDDDDDDMPDLDEMPDLE